MSEDEMKTSSWQEAFRGKDVVRGGELVNNLLYESVGIPVYKTNLQEKKTKFLVDRKIGEDDFTVRQKEERDHTLLGLIIPSNNNNEFVYLGVEEGGFIFHASNAHATKFHKDTTTSFSLNWERFGDYLANSIFEIDGETKIILKEENDPNRFMEVVVNSVQNERVRMQQIKEKRTNIRENLLKKLFGKE